MNDFLSWVVDIIAVGSTIYFLWDPFEYKREEEWEARKEETRKQLYKAYERSTLRRMVEVIEEERRKT